MAHCMHCERWIPVLLWHNCRIRVKSVSTQPWLSESIVTSPSVKPHARTDCWKQKLRRKISLKFVTAHFANLGDLDDISQLDSTSSRQGPNEVRWRPGQEASLAPPRSNLSYFGSKCSVLKKVLVALLWLFVDPVVIRHPHSDRAPGNCAPLAPWLEWYWELPALKMANWRLSK